MRQSTLFKTFGPVAAGLLLLAAYGLVGSSDVESERADAELYCDMVKLNKHDPQKGWPDYKGTYDDYCIGGMGGTGAVASR